LTLEAVSPQTIVVQDEPVDVVTGIPTAAFFEAVRFSADQPLHGVVAVETSTGLDVLVVALQRATYEPAAASLAYVAEKLDDYVDIHGIGVLQAQDGNFTLPSEFGATTLYLTNAFCHEGAGTECQFL
jgi:hypothetical protein